MVQRRFAFAFVLLCSAANVLYGQDCFYTLRMFAADGNGWGGSYVTVGTGPGGMNTMDYTITGADDEVMIELNVNDVFYVIYTPVGSQEEQISFAIDFFGVPRFISATPPGSGLLFAESVACIPPPAQPSDCIGANTWLLPDPYILTPPTSSAGSIFDLNDGNQGCLEQGETPGFWLHVGGSTWPYYSGDLAFTITPDQPADHDFALWGPFPFGTPVSEVCAQLGEPFRCSYAATSGQTGLNYSSAETTQDAMGDGFVASVNNSSGYFLLYIGRKDGHPLQCTLTFNLPTSVDPTLFIGDRQLYVWPNPTERHITVQLNGTGATIHELEAIDVLGRMVVLPIVPHTSSVSGIGIDLDHLVRGTYTLIARNAQGQVVGSTRVLKH